ncbi:MAG: hypothetical protein CMB69_03755 [Euryarchaeota archaeon]|nr:hypothetical protein [Euryarchaeota archaeon]
MWATLPARDVPVLNVAFVGSEGLARSLAKSNDVRDIESYVHKEERNGEVCIISLLRPLKHPEKIRPLLSVLNVAEVGVVEIGKVDAALGEVLVSFGVSGIRNGIAIINPSEEEWVDSEQVRTILSQAGLEGWSIHESLPEVHDLREELFRHLDNMLGEGEGEALILPVDQHFNVKGVGLVAIGYVQTGSVNKHDEVLILPANEKGVVRSLQVMDDDVDVAKAGDRVGVALRNLREEALHRGCMITHPDSEVMIRHDKSSLKIRVAPFQKRVLQVDDVIHAAVDLQFVVGRVTHVEGIELGVDWDCPLWVRKENLPSILITQLDAMPMRVIGVVESIV